MTRKNYQRPRLFRVSLRQQPSLLISSGDGIQVEHSGYQSTGSSSFSQDDETI